MKRITFFGESTSVMVYSDQSIEQRRRFVEAYILFKYMLFDKHHDEEIEEIKREM